MAQSKLDLNNMINDRALIWFLENALPDSLNEISVGMSKHVPPSILGLLEMGMTKIC